MGLRDGPHLSYGAAQGPAEMIRVLALERTDDNRTEAARLLGISRRTMQRKLKEMGLIEE